MPSATAQRLLRELGPEAIEVVNECVADCRRLGDEASARFWLDVKAELESLPGEDDADLAEADEPARDVYFRRRRWMLIQKAEGLRRRGIDAARAAGGAEAHRQEMIGIALQWFELSREYDWLAGLL